MDSKVVKMTDAKLEKMSRLDKIIISVAVAFILNASYFGIRVVIATLGDEGQIYVDNAQDMRIDSLETNSANATYTHVQLESKIGSLENKQNVEYESIQRSLNFIVDQIQQINTSPSYRDE